MPLIGICLTSLLIVVLGNPLFRNTTADLQPHPDEIIPMRVIQTMDAHGDLNSDWGRADLPAYFQVCRYNFSGYIVASYVAIKLLAPETLGSDQALRAALQRLSAISAILSLCVVLLLLTRQLGLGYGIAGAIGTAILPQFFQSAHYARPEAMATLGFTLCFALATLRPAATSRRLATVVAIGVLAGFLTSIKITYGVSLAFALPLLFALSWERDRHVVRLAMAACCVITLGGAFLAGFAMGAPHVLVDFQGYLDGVRALQQQYSGIHPPHSPASAGPLAQGELLARYYVATVGLPFIALFVMGHVARDMRGAKAAFAIITLVLMALFLCQTVFFERNFSPLMPSFVIVATSGLAWLVGKLPSSAPGSRNSAPVELVIASLVSLCGRFIQRSLVRRIHREPPAAPPCCRGHALALRASPHQHPAYLSQRVALHAHQSRLLHRLVRNHDHVTP